MQGSDEWRVNNANGRQDVRTKPPYPGIGRCSAKLSPCPLPVSANQVSMSPVVAPGRDAALMEFEEASIDFLSPQLPADFSTVRWNTPLGEIIVPGSALGEGNEDEVIKPSHAEACDIVPSLVLWEELFNASEDYFVNDGGDADSGEAPVEGVPVGESSVGDVLCMMRSSWGSVDARVAPVMVLGVVCVGVALFMILVSLFMFVGGVVFGG